MVTAMSGDGSAAPAGGEKLKARAVMNAISSIVFIISVPQANNFRLLAYIIREKKSKTSF
jgi:hypothetical protein